ncbi:Charged multivesicular body protein 3 [Tupaia chinensis]|uniref:Charged multivesicular body protein 3 n=1 Tax=Tupaia chinensis TaxID=246437 RepID=L9JER0_TUPCH|nr:Charged multivesicular body protein 3 [Tupaia chinensis]
MGLFGKTQEKPPKELVNEWSLKIRKEMRVVDRKIRDIQREEEKVKRSVKDAAKKGQKDVCVVLAKEMDQVKEGSEQALCIQSTRELGAHGDEEPARCSASGWLPTEEHRSDEGHAESCENPRNPSHHAGAVQRDDEGWDHRRDVRGHF